MDNAMDFQVRYDDHRRQMAWVNDERWQFEQLKAHRRVRETVARALLALAARLAPTMEQPRTAS